MKGIAVATVALGILLAADVLAVDPPERSLWIGAFAGPTLAMDSWDLSEAAGRAREMDTVSGTVGVRLGLQPLRWLALEGAIGVVLASPEDTGDDNLTLVAHGDLLLLPLDSAIAPYLALGGGGYRNVSGDLGSDNDWQVHYAIGLRVWMFEDAAFRLDLRHVLTDSFDDDIALASNVEVTVGVDLMVWRDAGITSPPDGDGDGLPDLDDRCPRQAGTAANVGCPDMDGDGLVDLDDACPDAAGQAAVRGCPDGDGDGVADADDHCADVAGSAATRGCPDSDGDGLMDTEDPCPTEAGTLADGGCPDRDGDAIIDLADQCPDAAGLDAYAGCPSPEPLPDTPLATLSGVNFRYNHRALRRSANPILDGVVRALVANPTWQVRIDGHTDSMGEKDYNRALSLARAESVKRYLVQAGIAASRVTTFGFGEDKPIAPNNTETSRTKNRRVEIRATHQPPGS